MNDHTDIDAEQMQIAKNIKREKNRNIKIKRKRNRRFTHRRRKVCNKTGQKRAPPAGSMPCRLRNITST